VEGVASSLTAEQEVAVRDELEKYDELKDKIKIELRGGRDGLILSYRTLLEEIRQRIRKHFGWSLLPSEVSGLSVVPYAGGISESDKAASRGDSDIPRPAFTRDLFS
jgi:hypothetical protein